MLDLYDRRAGEEPDSGSYTGLFFHLTSSADIYSRGPMSGSLRDSGFRAPNVHRLPQLPGLALLRAERLDCSASAQPAPL